jgi:hypothetical protein
MKIILAITIYIASITSLPIDADKNLQILVKRKFESLPDQFMDDPYYIPDVQYLRSANLKCILTKLNLIERNDVSFIEMRDFDATEVYKELEEDFQTLVIVTMYHCIEDIEGFLQHYFARNIKNPRFRIPADAIECAKFELMVLDKLAPLVNSFERLENYTKTECNKILLELKAVNKSWDCEFRGCLKVYDNHSLEYSLKFAIMSHETPSKDIYEAEKAKYQAMERIVEENFIDCMLKMYF